VQMDAEKGADKIGEKQWEGKSIPADNAANSRKEICENLRERKSIPADHADYRRWTQKSTRSNLRKSAGESTFMLIVQMDAEKGSDKICENLREKKVFPKITQITAVGRRRGSDKICENLREKKAFPCIAQLIVEKISAKICGKNLPADYADNRRWTQKRTMYYQRKSAGEKKYSHKSRS